MLQKSNIEFTIDKSKIEGVKDMNNEIFPSHFLTVICGKPGSGKTTLLKFILMNSNLLFKKYDYVFILSPSWREYTCLFLPEKNFTDKLDFDWIANKLTELDKTIEYTNVLFIFDDLISELYKNSKSKEIMDFIFNRRHILKNGMISIIITSQKYKIIPPIIRSNITVFIFFKLNNIDVKHVKEELIFNPDDFASVLKLVFSPSSNNGLNNGNNKLNEDSEINKMSTKDDTTTFLVYRIDNDVYFKNFNKILL